jgi:hypothetical protein
VIVTFLYRCGSTGRYESDLPPWEFPPRDYTLGRVEPVPGRPDLVQARWIFVELIRRTDDEIWYRECG